MKRKPLPLALLSVITAALSACGLTLEGAIGGRTEDGVEWGARLKTPPLPWWAENVTLDSGKSPVKVGP